MILRGRESGSKEGASRGRRKGRFGGMIFQRRRDGTRGARRVDKMMSTGVSAGEGGEKVIRFEGLLVTRVVYSSNAG